MLREEGTQLTGMSEVLASLDTGTPALSETDVTVADLFQVLASPIRLGVLRLLLGGERYVGDLIEELGIAQPRLSNHLACLRTCGLVRTRRQGNFIYYAIADPRVVDIVRMGEALAELNAQELAHCDVLQQER
jgi:ArsR family transcriptional regulator, cadmium/lead-responsive transcriptional repressor